jgi:hypothetical protein
MLDGPKANPLIEDRLKLEQECLRLVRNEASLSGEDPVEVMARHSLWMGSAALNPSSMSDDRLLHTVRSLRKSAALRQPSDNWLAGAPEWIAARGGPVELVRKFLEWRAGDTVRGETDQAAFKRWVVDAPAGVYALVSARIYYARKHAK